MQGALERLQARLAERDAEIEAGRERLMQLTAAQERLADAEAAQQRLAETEAELAASRQRVAELEASTASAVPEAELRALEGSMNEVYLLLPVEQWRKDLMWHCSV